jgi:hypothetical protein
MPFTVEVCPPCSESGWEVHDIRNKMIRQWRTYANRWGQHFGVNPGLILAVISLESNGNVGAGRGTSYVGLTQIGQGILDMYNKAKKTSYKLTDLTGDGPTIKTESAAADLAIKIFAEFISNALTALDASTDTYPLDRLVKDATTNWNGSICSGTYTLTFYPFSAENVGTATGRRIPNNFSCYGENIYRLMNYANSWCGTSPWYSRSLSDITFSDTYRKVVGRKV